MKRLLVGAVALLGLAWAADGQQLYQQNCAGCHGQTAQGVPGAFPPLAKNPRVADEAHVLKVIREGLKGPLEVNGQQFNGAMPAMPQVSEADAKAIAAYLQGLGGATPAQATPTPQSQPTQAASPQMAAKGKALFTGQARLQNGGAPCMACHSAGSSTQMGGGNLGRDLTDLHTRLGAAGIQGVLSSIAFPVMREAYKDKALTPEEIGALTAYFAEVAKEPARAAWVDSGRLFYAGFFGALALFGVMYLFWINRRVSLAERLRRRRA
jgi:mono/diheme cytochrome c family protein